MDIAAWLASLGLERYNQVFHENEIDVGVLPRLTADDLKDMGVVIVGHRRKLLEAIADLQTPQGNASVPHAPPLAGAARRPDAERRYLTVMFTDIVGSTALSAQLDPEDMRDIIRLYQNTVAGEITRFEGHIAKFMGDGVLAYFGWPRAHEDEAERAVRAGLAVSRAVSRLQIAGGQSLETRIGIATGLVVVGDLVGEGAAQEQAVVGDTPNLAARLQGAAEPGMVVIAEATRLLIGDLFVLQELGTQSFKGIPGPTPVFAVLGERALESRFAARQAGRVSPIVGPRPGTRPADRALAAGQERRRSDGPAQRRGRDRQVADHRSPGRGIARRTAFSAALPMFALSRRQHALPGDPADHPRRRLCRGRRSGAPLGPARGAAGPSQRRYQRGCPADGGAHWARRENRVTARSP